MQQKNERKLWFVAPAVISLLIATASLRSVLWAAASLLLLPVFSAALSVTAGWVGSAAVCLTAGAVTVGTLPTGMLPVLLPWCALCLAIPLIPLRRKGFRPLMWVLLCFAAWIAGAALLQGEYDGQITAGLANAATEWVNASPDAESILLNAYSMGWARLTGAEALMPALRVMGTVFIPEDTKMQLLWSLRVTLEEILPAAICRTIIYHTALTALLCTIIPDWRRRRNGEEGELPRPEQWFMPRGIGLAAATLCLGWLPANLGGGAAAYLGNLSLAVFRVSYLLQGVSLMLWMQKKFGVKSAARSLWAVALSVLAPIIPIIMGVIDQRRDARHLRPKEEAE